MSTLGNITWLILGGFFTGLGYIIGGLAICLTIIGIPMGLKAIQFGFSMMTPFGKVATAKSEQGCLAGALNIVWLLLFGWELAILHAVFGLIWGITIIGIPFARQHFKLVPIALLPFSYELDSASG